MKQVNEVSQLTSLCGRQKENLREKKRSWQGEYGVRFHYLGSKLESKPSAYERSRLIANNVGYAFTKVDTIERSCRCPILNSARKRGLAWREARISARLHTWIRAG
jgi:hypothetical protein